MAQIDVVVCGLGIIGSAALCELSRRGVRALGIEQYAPGHARGSSHGATRIFRLGYFEHPSYVPLLERASELWRDLSRASGRKLLHVTGIAEIGLPNSALVRGTLASAHMYDLKHELLTADQVMQRFPAFRLPADYVGVFQPEGGFLEAESSIDGFFTLARAAGGEIRSGQTVRLVEPRPGGVRVITDRTVIDADAAIISVGPWLPSLLPDLDAPLRVTRQVTAWLRPTAPALFLPESFPVFLMETEDGIHYGYPLDEDGCVKVAKHHHRNEVVDPEQYDRTISAEDEATIRAPLSEHLPAANGALATAQTCLYTVTPDHDFIIDRLPGRLIVASPCSGHGFKFAPVVGEILADLAMHGTTDYDISRFRLSRFR